MTIEELIGEYNIKQDELREKIVQEINGTGLPPIIVEPVLKDLYEKIHNQREEQTKIARLNREKRKEEDAEKQKEEKKNKKEDNKASK